MPGNITVVQRKSKRVEITLKIIINNKNRIFKTNRMPATRFKQAICSRTIVPFAAFVFVIICKLQCTKYGRRTFNNIKNARKKKKNQQTIDSKLCFSYYQISAGCKHSHVRLTNFQNRSKQYSSLLLDIDR